MLTGDATNADPVCSLSPHHHIVTEAVARAQSPAAPVTVHPIVFRDHKSSRALSRKAEQAAPV